jgi:hypothetical protein
MIPKKIAPDYSALEGGFSYNFAEATAMGELVVASRSSLISRG